MEKIILIRYGEISLKGLNKSFFVDTLIRNIKDSLKYLEYKKMEKIQGRFVLRVEEKDIDRACKSLLRIFGIASISVATRVESDMETIKSTANILVKNEIDLSEPKTFKVNARRGDKKFPLTSPQINGELGGFILSEFPELDVDVHNPDMVLYLEVREKTYMYTSIMQGKGGLPVGTGGKAALLISGGIDSPVAGYMIAKRGVNLIAVHFHSYPYTSERARDKVIRLMEIVARYSGRVKLYIVPFTDLQLAIGEHCNERYSTLIMRRYMMKIATEIAKRNKAMALITGESVGQVASQTLESLMVTDSATDLPVFRPVIGMDKNEIIAIAEEIETFETSILPYEDCCTIFVPKHPQTKPKLENVIREESFVENANELMNKAIDETEMLEIFGK
ncbi:tRNA uracil 4-sulfurtransferase ThiI [Alkalibacter saccharofermentans]|uniref:Probable tRNA sulfurtransferase n=1 Tax=Alkalibacter saccharofermentans DSM 14828 TaxID=1120975 RepID=A0A1M4S7F2_9FIRM|nr:tRNA uracil 4-sulfurtransferase ThiI [Alkalibacter saccharofermentans]SHE28108.1 thiamine biosynthesis protein ThiI [Alkalibacter saccharofermentans DSM 14828]